MCSPEKTGTPQHQLAEFTMCTAVSKLEKDCMYTVTNKYISFYIEINKLKYNFKVPLEYLVILSFYIKLIYNIKTV